MLSDSTYVTVVARLSFIQQELERSAPDRADSARRAVLEEHDVELEDLRGYARAHGSDPEHMAAIWRSVRDEVERLREEREEREEQEDPEDRVETDGNGPPPTIRPLPDDAAGERIL